MFLDPIECFRELSFGILVLGFCRGRDNPVRIRPNNYSTGSKIIQFMLEASRKPMNQFPTVASSNMIQTPCPEFGRLSLNFTHNGQCPTLREGCGFQTETKTSQIRRRSFFQRILRPGAHGLDYLFTGHAVSIVLDCYDGFSSLPDSIDPYIFGQCRY